MAIGLGPKGGHLAKTRYTKQYRSALKLGLLTLATWLGTAGSYLRTDFLDLADVETAGRP